MMKFKPNKLATFIIAITVMFISLLPFLMITYIKYGKEDISPFLMFFEIIILIIIIDFFFSLFNLIAMLFTKVQVIIYDKFFKHLYYTVYYEDVKLIVFDLGELGKTSITPCSITFFNEESKMLVSLDDPSFIMCLILIKKCKNAKFTLSGYKFYLIAGLIINILLILCVIFGGKI